jgi:hypothetical protein
LFWHLTARYRTVSCNPVWHQGLPPVDTPLWRLLTIRYVRLLRRFLRHWCAGFCAASRRPFKVLIGRLQIVLAGDLWAVAHPLADDVGGIGFLKLGLPRRSQIVEDPRPRCQAGPFDDPRQLGSQIST